MSKNKIWLSSPHIGINEINYVNNAFETNWIAPLGPNVDLFEKKLEEKIGNKFVSALSSGTAALHLALILLNIKKGDIVFCQSLTFSASANPIIYTGAEPVFIDSETDTWNMDPYLLEDALDQFNKKNKLPKAIIVVHLYGMPAKIEQIINIANKYNVPVIEDAAEALGSLYKNRFCGTIADIGFFSFNGNKIITTSGGGALFSKNEDYILKSKFLATQARDPAPHYEHSEIGYNYRLSNVLAGIGIGQLEVLDERVLARRNNFDRYTNYFKNLQFPIEFQNEDKESKSNRWLTCILIKTEKQNKNLISSLIKMLELENIESRPIWKPMHLQPVFSKCNKFTNGVSEELFNTGLCLPSGSNLEENDFDRIFNSLDNFFKF